MNQKNVTIAIVLIIIVLGVALFVGSPSSSNTATSPATTTATVKNPSDSQTKPPAIVTTSVPKTPSASKTPSVAPTTTVSGTHYDNLLYNNINMNASGVATQLQTKAAQPNAQVIPFVITPQTIWTKNGTRLSNTALLQEKQNFPFLSFNVIASSENANLVAKEVDLKTVTFTMQRSAYFTFTATSTLTASMTTNNFAFSDGMSQAVHIPGALYNLLASGQEPLTYTSTTRFLKNGVASSLDAIKQALAQNSNRVTLKASGYISGPAAILTQADFLL